MKNLLESIAVFTIKKLLDYLMKKYNLSNLDETILLTKDKIQKSQDVKLEK